MGDIGHRSGREAGAVPSWFQRRLLPGFAFKAVVIGGGYATGREIATFFLPSGPVGGLLGMLLATAIWSGGRARTFLFAFDNGSRDYRTFFRNLLGRYWQLFEAAYLLTLVVVLAVFASAAGTIGSQAFGLPTVVGTLALMVGIALIATFGNDSVEALFKYVTFFLYGTYAAFLLLSFSHFGDRIVAAFGREVPTTGWAMGGVTYAGYNIIGAIIILPVTRHLLTRRDAVIAGLLAGPMAMAPAMLFFIVMAGFYPAVLGESLPSDFLLGQLRMPLFRIIFETMILAALLESGTGAVHALNERLAASYAARRGGEAPAWVRLAVTVALLTLSVFVAGRFGFVELIARGYSWLAVAILLIYVAPLLTVGLWRVWRRTALDETMPG